MSLASAAFGVQKQSSVCIEMMRMPRPEGPGHSFACIARFFLRILDQKFSGLLFATPAISRGERDISYRLAPPNIDDANSDRPVGNGAVEARQLPWETMQDPLAQQIGPDHRTSPFTKSAEDPTNGVHLKYSDFTRRNFGPLTLPIPTHILQSVADKPVACLMVG